MEAYVTRSEHNAVTLISIFHERCLNSEALRNNALLSRVLNKSARRALLCRSGALVVS